MKSVFTQVTRRVMLWTGDSSGLSCPLGYAAFFHSVCMMLIHFSISRCRGLVICSLHVCTFVGCNEISCNERELVFTGPHIRSITWKTYSWFCRTHCTWDGIKHHNYRGPVWIFNFLKTYEEEGMNTFPDVQNWIKFCMKLHILTLRNPLNVLQ